MVKTIIKQCGKYAMGGLYFVKKQDGTEICNLIRSRLVVSCRQNTVGEEMESLLLFAVDKEIFPAALNVSLVRLIELFLYSDMVLQFFFCKMRQ